jgi:hypothetical protein
MEYAAQAISYAQKFSNLWQVMALITICGFALLAYKVHKNSLQISEVDDLEKERAANRKLERDKQISDINHKLEKLSMEFDANISESTIKISGIGKSLDKHVVEHQSRDGHLQKSIDSLDDRLRIIEENLIERKEFAKLQADVHSIDKSMVKVLTVLEERVK